MSYSVLTKKSSTVNTENSGEVDEREIESAIEKHGVTPGGSYMMKAEAAAANESMNSGLYVTFSPHPSCSFTSAAYDGIKDGTSQCCRIGNKSICTCGHSLLNHQPVKLRSGYIKPPTCLNCRCGGYSYSPARPEECGQWWLPRRKDFILREWQQRIRQNPHDYCCLGCDQKISDHETIFESRENRAQRGAMVDHSYIPLSDNAYLTSKVIEGKGKIGGRIRKPANLLRK